MTSQERLFKINKIFFSYHTKDFANIFIQIGRLSQELFMSKFRYQNSTKWWRHQWLGLNLLKTRSFLFLSIIQKTSQTKFYKVWTSKSKVTHVEIPVTIWEKTKIREKNFWVTKRGTKGIISGAGFEDYKSGQEGLQIRARITNRCTTTLTLKSTTYFFW